MELAEHLFRREAGRLVAIRRAARRGIEDRRRLVRYPFYFATLGEFEPRLGRRGKVGENFRAALKLVRNPMEKRFLEGRLRACVEEDFP